MSRPPVSLGFVLVTSACVTLAGCDLVLGLDNYKEGPATGGAGGGTTASASTDASTSMSSGPSSSSSSSGMPCELNTTMECYSGTPSSTKDVGDCRHGTAT